MSFGEKIKKIRIDNNLTQQEFADKFFVTRQAVSRWEQDKSIPNIDVLDLIAKKFNVSIDYLISENDIEDEKEIVEEDKTLLTSSDDDKKYNLPMKITFFSILSAIVLMIVFVFTYYTIDALNVESYALYVAPKMVSEEEVKNSTTNRLTLGGSYYLSSAEGSWYIYSRHEIKGDIKVEFIGEIFSTNDKFYNDIMISKKIYINNVETIFNYYRVPDIVEIISFNIYGSYINNAIYSNDEIKKIKKYHMKDAISYRIKAYYDDDTLIFDYALSANYENIKTCIYISDEDVKDINSLNCLILY